MAIDLVCGMTVDEKTAKWISEYKGATRKNLTRTRGA